jgi:hypothetical protein
MTTDRVPIHGEIVDVNDHTGYIYGISIDGVGNAAGHLSGRVVVVPEELWDQMLPPVPVPPVFPLSDIDLRMWAVEQAVLSGGPSQSYSTLESVADRLIAYVRGNTVSPPPSDG